MRTGVSRSGTFFLKSRMKFSFGDLMLICKEGQAQLTQGRSRANILGHVVIIGSGNGICSSCCRVRGVCLSDDVIGDSDGKQTLQKTVWMACGQRLHRVMERELQAVWQKLARYRMFICIAACCERSLHSHLARCRFKSCLAHFFGKKLFMYFFL